MRSRIAAGDPAAIRDRIGAACAAQVRQPCLGQREAEFVADHRAAREHCDVLQHGLAAITEARRLHRAGPDRAAHGVDDQRGQCVALHLLGDHQQGPAGLHHLLQQRQQVLQRGQALVVEQDRRILEHRGLPLGVVHEVGRQEAAVELQAFDHLELAGQAGAVLDRDGAFAADLVDGAGEQLADRAVVVGRDGRHVGDLL